MENKSKNIVIGSYSESTISTRKDEIIKFLLGAIDSDITKYDYLCKHVLACIDTSTLPNTKMDDLSNPFVINKNNKPMYNTALSTQLAISSVVPNIVSNPDLQNKLYVSEVHRAKYMDTLKIVTLPQSPVICNYCTKIGDTIEYCTKAKVPNAKFCAKHNNEVYTNKTPVQQKDNLNQHYLPNVWTKHQNNSFDENKNSDKQKKGEPMISVSIPIINANVVLPKSVQIKVDGLVSQIDPNNPNEELILELITMISQYIV